MSMLSRFATLGGGGDPYWANVSLLLVGNGANGTTTNIVDSSNNLTLTANGSTTISTAISPPAVSNAGSGVVYFDGNGDTITSPYNAKINFGVDNFTVETWFYPTVYVSGTSPRIIEIGVFAASDYFVIDYDVNANSIRVQMGSSGGATIITSYTGLPTLNQWAHIAVVRTGTGTNQVKLYINGVNVSSGTSVSLGSNGALWIGGLTWASATTYSITGYIYDLRITKGVARYTANYTPPPFPPTAAMPTY
jgi:hypothetical protein